MTEIRYTLMSDGSSDAALIPILDWLLIQNGIKYAIQSNRADLRRLRFPPKTLKERIRICVDLYPCELLFVHRDSERESRERRVVEINSAIQELIDSSAPLPHICVVPVKMTEAWLLFDEQAIRHAAGNRYGRHPIRLPRLNQIESIPDPKSILFQLVRESSGLRGHRLKRFPVNHHAYRVPEFLMDFSPLRSLPAFFALEGEIRNLILDQSWHINLELVE